MNKLQRHERMCSPCSERVRKCVCWCPKTCLIYTPTHAWWSKTPLWMHATLSAKVHMHPCMRAYATVQKLLCELQNCCKLSWVLCQHCAGCRLPHALLLFRRNQSPDAARSRKSSKSTLAHDAVAAGVAQASFNHPCRCRPHPAKFVCGSHSELSHGAHLSQKKSWRQISRVFEIVTVQAAADDENSNLITTVKLDVIEILRADRRIKWCERLCPCMELHGVSPRVQSYIISLYDYVIKTVTLSLRIVTL